MEIFLSLPRLHQLLCESRSVRMLLHLKSVSMPVLQPRHAPKQYTIIPMTPARSLVSVAIIQQLHQMPKLLFLWVIAPMALSFHRV